MKTELVVAIIAGLVAIASAVIAYVAQEHAAANQKQIAEFQLKNQNQITALQLENQKQIAALQSESETQKVRLQAALQQAHERQKPFLEKQLEYYFEASEVAAKISRTDNPEDRAVLVKRFWQLYWGPLAMVEDPDVEGAMVNFGSGLQADGQDRAALERLSLSLAHACRGSLQKLWGTDLGELKNLREQPK
jgi:hypothetical protein